MGSLRILLALAVLLSHMPLALFQFLGGGLAVQLFYIVSGFYMALVLDTKYHDRSLFYSNRLLRLLPAYAVMLPLAALLVIGLPWLPLPPEAARWFAYLAVALLLPALFRLTGRWRADRWLGELSYPIYLSQLAVIGVVLRFEPPAGFWIALVGTLAVSAALLLLVDLPLDRWRQRRVARGSARQADPSIA